MKKGLSIFGLIKNLISFIILAAIAIAILRLFHYDVFSAFKWCIDFIFNVIMTIADKIGSSDLFRQLFGR